MTDTTIPFRFEDLPVINGKRVEPPTWGPIYSKPPKAGRKVDIDRWPTNAPSGQKGDFNAAKHRAKIKAEFCALVAKESRAWAYGEPREIGYKITETIYEAYALAMAEKRAREARSLAQAA